MSKKNIRSSQAIAPFGIGQLLTFPGDISYIIAGLDSWENELNNHKLLHGSSSIDISKLKILEPRLQKLLGVNYFLKPFPYLSNASTNKGLHLPAFRFPGWHYCSNIGCGVMQQYPITISDDKIICQSCDRMHKMIPVRFIAVCSHGHLQDLPFIEWVHNGTPNENNHRLKYISTGGSGDLGSILIKCSCGQQKTLAGIMNVNKEEGIIYNSPLARLGLSGSTNFSKDNPNNSNPNGQYCKGHKPWLGLQGITNSNHCGNHLEVLIRGGSNVHYANISSSIYIPEFAEKTNKIAANIIQEIGIEKLINLYETDTNRNNFRAVLSYRSEVIQQLIDIELLLSEIESVILNHSNGNKNEENTTELDLRIQEYNTFLNGFNAENGEFKAVIKNINNYDNSDFIIKYFEKIILIEKLKETKAFTGFSRITQSSNTDISILSNEPINWLPATEVFGEGIYLEFNSKKLSEWLQMNTNAFSTLINRYENSNAGRGPDQRFSTISPEFILMHTFAHLLIKRLCYSCGYGSSSLRERIYFNNNPSNKMNGILIYTSSGDAEGSLGGLVRQGTEKYLGKLLMEAVEEARWCSADPVCSDIGQRAGQGQDNVNGSACHNCCLISETSCEMYNKLLDRASIIGCLDNPLKGFFNIRNEIT